MLVKEPPRTMREIRPLRSAAIACMLDDIDRNAREEQRQRDQENRQRQERQVPTPYAFD